MRPLRKRLRCKVLQAKILSRLRLRRLPRGRSPDVPCLEPGAQGNLLPRPERKAKGRTGQRSRGRPLQRAGGPWQKQIQKMTAAPPAGLYSMVPFMPWSTNRRAALLSIVWYRHPGGEMRSINAPPIAGMNYVNLGIPCMPHPARIRYHTTLYSDAPRARQTERRCYHEKSKEVSAHDLDRPFENRGTV